MRSFNSAAAFSVNVNAMTLRGSTPGRLRISATRCEMTWVFPEPAQAMICSGSSRQVMASACASVYFGIQIPARLRISSTSHSIAVVSVSKRASLTSMLLIRSSFPSADRR